MFDGRFVVTAALAALFIAVTGAGRGAPLSIGVASAEEHFGTLPPGAELPSGDDCAARVRYSGWEPRPENAAANQTTGFSGVTIDGAGGAFNARYAGRIDGAFTGTTDEIIQWAACKWGFDEDTVRAQAVQESYWRQAGVGDWNGREYLSYGLLQVKKS